MTPLDLRQNNIDTLRTFAVVLVVILHCSSWHVKTAAFNQDFSFGFYVANIFDSFSRICVPLFVLISGRFLLGKQESTKIFYQKRASRVLIPLVSWSLIYMLYSVLGNYFFNGVWEIKPVLEDLLHGRPFYHLWYLYMLIGLYAVTPLVNSFINRFSRKRVWILAVFFLVVGFLLDLLAYWYDFELPFPLWFIFYLGYFIWGYLLRDSRHVAPYLLILAYIISSGSIVLLTNKTAQSGSFYFYNYLSPFVIIGALSIYKLFCQLKMPQNWLSKMASLSFGVYLVHAGVLDVFNKLISLSGTKFFAEPLVGIPVKFLIVFSLSALISYLILKVKYVKKII